MDTTEDDMPKNDSEALQKFMDVVLGLTSVDTEQVAMALSLGCYYGYRRANRRESLVECYNGALKDMMDALAPKGGSEVRDDTK